MIIFLVNEGSPVIRAKPPQMTFHFQSQSNETAHSQLAHRRFKISQHNAKSQNWTLFEILNIFFRFIEIYITLKCLNQYFIDWWVFAGEEPNHKLFDTNRICRTQNAGDILIRSSFLIRTKFIRTSSLTLLELRIFHMVSVICRHPRG